MYLAKLNHILNYYNKTDYSKKSDGYITGDTNKNQIIFNN